MTSKAIYRHMKDVHLLRDWKPQEDENVRMKVCDMDLEYFVTQQMIGGNLSRLEARSKCRTLASS